MHKIRTHENIQNIQTESCTIIFQYVHIKTCNYINYFSINCLILLNVNKHRKWKKKQKRITFFLSNRFLYIDRKINSRIFYVELLRSFFIFFFLNLLHKNIEKKFTQNNFFGKIVHVSHRKIFKYRNLPGHCSKILAPLFFFLFCILAHGFFLSFSLFFSFN